MEPVDPADMWPEMLVSDDPDVMLSYARDQSQFTAYALPEAVLGPRNTAEVAAVLHEAARRGLTVAIRGAGTGLSGGANAQPGSVVLSTHRLNRVVDIDPDERIAVVQPGVITGDLRTQVSRHGLWYPPDPGSVDSCSIGGNVATNAGGMCCVKYGVTRDFVLGLEVVLADGSVMRTGRRTAKGVAGYDLTGLLVGSEGTLGVITEVTVRLVPQPASAATVLATFNTLAAAGSAVRHLTRARTRLSMLEIMDRTTLQAVESMRPLGINTDTAAILLIQSDEVDGRAVTAEAATICHDAGADDVIVSDDAQEAELLLQARRLALPALERLGSWLLDDVCVPRTRIVDLMTHVETIAEHEGVLIGVFGHAGDGNMHPTIIYDKDLPDSRAAAQRAFDQITQRALELGGTITGEHGVGRLKRTWLEAELDETALRTHHALRSSLDPGRLLNPQSVTSEQVRLGSKMA